MSSERQIAANQRNGKMGSGPKNTSVTQWNATKHGLRAPRLSPLDDPEEYERLRLQLEQNWKPANCVERMLIERAALYATKATTADKFESQFVMSELDPCKVHFEREPSVDEILGKAKVLNPGSPAVVKHESFEKLVLYQRYGSNSMNLFFRTLHELERMQKLRRGEVVTPPQVLDVVLSPSVPIREGTSMNPNATTCVGSDSGCTPQPGIGARVETVTASVLSNNSEANSQQTRQDELELIRDGLQPSPENLVLESEEPKAKKPQHEASPPAHWQVVKPKPYWSS